MTSLNRFGQRHWLGGACLMCAGALLLASSAGAQMPWTVTPGAPAPAKPPAASAPETANQAPSWKIAPPGLQANSSPSAAIQPVTPAWAIEAPGLPVTGNALNWQASADRSVTALAQGGDGALWIATEDAGVWRYNVATQSWKQFTAKDGLADNNAYALAIDKAGRVWAGTLNHGVSVWNGSAWKNYGVLDGPLGERVFDIAVCPTDGDVWIATNVGLTRYSMKSDGWSYLTRADGLPSDQIEAIAFDAAGNIVLGTQCDGVALASAASGYKNWRALSGPDKMPLTPTGAGLPSSLINDVLVSRDGTVYAATTTGLAWSRDGGTNWRYVRGQDYAAKVQGLHGGAPAGWKPEAGALLAEDYVSALAQDAAGRLLVGHWRAGNEVLELNGTTGAPTSVFVRQKSGFVKAILPLPGGRALIARYNDGIG